MFKNSKARKTSKYAGQGRENSKHRLSLVCQFPGGLVAICRKFSVKKAQIFGKFGIIGNKHAKNSVFCGPSLVTKAGFCVVFGGRQW